MRLSPIKTLPSEALVLPLEGKDGTEHDYPIQPCSAEWWLKFAALKELSNDLLNGTKPADMDREAVKDLDSLGHIGFQRAVLGSDVLDAMVADGVSASEVRRAATVAFIWHATGGDDESAERAWSGKAPSSSTSTSTDEASTTKPPASGSGTTSRKTPKHN